MILTTKALNFNFSGDSLSYLVISCGPDVVKPGGTINVTVSAKLAVETNQSETAHITIYVSTVSEPEKVITQGDLTLPADASANTAQYTNAIPGDAVNNTYVQMKITHGTKTFSGIALSLVQNPTYFELRDQAQNLQAQNKNLMSTTDTMSQFAYIATFVAIVFIAATAYIIALTLRAGKKRKTFKQTTLQSEEQRKVT